VHELPRGTITFLFTDIEGSTRLLYELGPDAYAEALSGHHLIVREAIERHGGVEVDTQGDAFFVAFPTASGALEAAREAQEKLELPVRMGLHTARRSSPTRDTSASTFIARLESPQQATADRFSSRQRRPLSSIPASCATSASTGSRISVRPSGSSSSVTATSRR